MDGGIGEAALMGAIIGGGSSAITGGDPLKGALLGGLSSGVMSGFDGLTIPGATDAPQWAQDMGLATANAPTSSIYNQSLSPELMGGNQIQAGTRELFGLPNATPASSLMDSGINATNPMTAFQNSTNAAQAAAGMQPGQWVNPIDMLKANPWTFGGIAATNALPGLMTPRYPNAPGQTRYDGPLSKFRYDPSSYTPDVVRPPSPVYKAHYATGGIAALAPNDGVDTMHEGMYPQAQIDKTQYAVPTQTPVGAQAVTPGYEPKTDVYTGQEMPIRMKVGGALADLMKSRDKQDAYRSQAVSDKASVYAKAKAGDYDAMLALNELDNTPNQNYAVGGLSALNAFSHGKFLKGSGDGMSDSIHATIDGKQPARLADGEFVIPADVVSGLGNGSSSAGAKQLYAMMDRVRQSRTGKKKQAPAINPKKVMAA